jgi:hypothetical protein
MRTTNLNAANDVFRIPPPKNWDDDEGAGSHAKKKLVDVGFELGVCRRVSQKYRRPIAHAAAGQSGDAKAPLGYFRALEGRGGE